MRRQSEGFEMSPFARLIAAGRRLDQAVYLKTRLNTVGSKIPPGLRKVGARHGLMALVSAAVAVFAFALTTQGPSRIAAGEEGSARGAGEEGGKVPSESEESPSPGETASTKGPSRGPAGGGSRTAAGSAAVTDSTIKIGFVAFKGLAEVRTAITPGECYECGDNGLQIQAVVNHVNTRGGVAKRKVVPVIHEMDLRRTDTFDVWAQEACATFTEDNKVFAVVDLWGAGIYEDQLMACLARHGVPRIGYTEQDQKFADDYAPYFYSPSWINTTRAARIHVLGLVKQGFFEQGAKIGLIRFDTPSDQRAAEQGSKKALAAQGLELTEEAAVSYYNDRLSDVSVTASQMGNVVLRFQTNGITHVLIQDRALLAELVMDHAETQRYRPSYGLNSFSNLRDRENTVPKEQLQRALVVGFTPVLDIDPERAPPPNSNSQVCVDIMKKAGVAGAEGDPKGMSYCDAVFFLKMAGDNASALTVAGFRTAAEGLGTRFEPPAAHTARFGPSRHDGASAWRPLALDDGCSCFRYVGGLEQID